MNDYSKLVTNLQFSIIHAEYSEIDEAWANFAATFPYCRLYYVVKGHAYIYLKNSTIELLPGRMYFIPPYSISNVKVDGVFHHYWIHFNYDLQTEQALGHIQVCNEYKATEFDTTAFKLLVEKIYNRPANESLDEIAGKDALLKYIFSKFFPKNSTQKAVSEPKFLPVLDYIDKNLGRKITNEELSKLMFLNPTYFSNSFSAHFGVSPQQYILQKKLNRAINLLYENNKSIKEIAFLCGFENESYFNRQFKKIYGIPPGKFLKRIHSSSTPHA